MKREALINYEKSSKIADFISIGKNFNDFKIKDIKMLLKDGIDCFLENYKPESNLFQRNDLAMIILSYFTLDMECQFNNFEGKIMKICNFFDEIFYDLTINELIEKINNFSIILKNIKF